MVQSSYEPVAIETSQPILDSGSGASFYSNLRRRDKLPHTPSAAPKRKSHLILCTFAIVILACLLIYQSLSPPTATTPKPTGLEFGGCGDSVAAARAIGCRFDPMSWHWVPEPCHAFEKELADSFLLRAHFRFYRNYTLEPEDEIEMGEILNGDHEVVYTPDRYHPIHCTYMWMKIHKAWVEKRPIDNVAMSLGHSHHCQLNTLNPYLGELGGGNCTASGVCVTRLRAEFNTCGYY